jgi:biopolymer transport protein ExbD
MAATNNASAVPAADDTNAWIVTITADGSLYFGVHPVTLHGLEEQMTVHPRNREQTLYIKADARTPYANVQKALDAARDAMFEAPVLLTSQQQSATPGTMMPPKGLEVMVSEPAADSVVVEVYAGQVPLKVNNEDVAPTALQTTIGEVLQNRSEKVVAVKAAGSVPFAEVAHVIDVCRAAGAKVAIDKPSL